MTDTEMERRKAICKVAGVADIDDVSDGFHTFRQLYYQRMMLFATIVKQNRDKAWKSLRHEDGELCFGGGWFIVGIDTPEGSYTYHYEDNFYSLFDCEELERSKHWDGHTEKDVTRLLSLPSTQPERCEDCENFSKTRLWIPQPERKKGKWIPCSERLPEYMETVLTWDGGAFVIEKRIPFVRDDDGEPLEGDWWVSDDYDECESEYYPNLRDGAAIAWMPLPEPYKGEQG